MDKSAGGWAGVGGARGTRLNYGEFQLFTQIKKKIVAIESRS